MPKWIEGTVVNQKRWTRNLFTLQVEADVAAFEAGQFAKLALPGEGGMVARPDPFVYAPGGRPPPVFFGSLPAGPAPQRLPNMEAGDAIYLAPRPAGFLVLSEIPEAENLWLISTGTGVGPFLSILKTEAPWQRFRNVVLVHAVRYAEELTYRDSLSRLLGEHGEQMRVVSFVSREEKPGALHGRVPIAIEEGRLETAAGVALSAKTSQVMICGNPEMVTDTNEALTRRGMKKHRRREPGHITVENYW